MPDENDSPLTEEELALARQGQALISAAVAGTRAPHSLREGIQRDRERANAFKHRQLRLLRSAALEPLEYPDSVALG